MQINSFTSAGTAASVWASATRTLTADPATDAGAATFVWTHAARTLTADPTPYTDISANNVNLGAGVLLDLRPAAGKRRFITFLSSQTTMLFGTYDGTTFVVSNLSANAVMGTMFNVGAVGTVPKNTSGGNIVYGYSGWDRG